jgi:two-component system NtrC family sensor kinase
MLRKIREVERQGEELARSAAFNEKRAMLETLVGGIAHELNNKLAPVLGYAELLGFRLEHEPGDSAEHCRMIALAAREAAKIIQQLKQVARPPTLECAACDPRALVEEAGVLLRFRLRSFGVRLDLAVPPALPAIWADPGQIKQVLVNLMLNAMDAMEGRPERHLTVRAEAKPGAVVLRVEDTGAGIPPGTLSRIFDPFFTTKALDRGSGLGLSLCQGIVKQHHGDIQVESTVGQGTTFSVTLPRAPEDLPVAPHRPNPRPVPPKLPAGLEILAVDDEEAITALVRATFQGQWVTRAHGGAEAIRHLGDRDFDLVLTDLRMPGVDGFQVLAWMGRERPDVLARTLVLTGETGSSLQDGELAGLGLPVLRKPFAPQDLLRACAPLAARTRITRA